jgi:hypothetical protein
MYVALTLEFKNTALDDAKSGCMIVCDGIHHLISMSNQDNDKNCTSLVDMSTYQIASVPGYPELLDLIHVQLRNSISDSFIFSEQARANLTSYFHDQHFFRYADAQVIMITQRDDTTTLKYGIIALFGIVIFILIRFIYKLRYQKYTRISNNNSHDDVVDDTAFPNDSNTNGKTGVDNSVDDGL